MGNCYQDRDNLLLSIGFNSYKEYLLSPLWLTIRKEVFIRDACQCRARGCAVKGCKQAHHISYSKAVLLGLDCARIVTVCLEHHEWIEFKEGKKVPFEEAQWRTLQLVAGVNPRKGQTEKRIGNWFRSQVKNSFDTGVRVLDRLAIESPEWYRKVVSQIKRIPNYHALYGSVIH